MSRKIQPAAKPPLAYTVPELADSIGRSAAFVTEHITAGNLVASYPGVHPIILTEEAQRWLKSLPTEKPERRAS
jgi:hypothetical protein